jgi:peptidylprolyl isomerase
MTSRRDRIFAWVGAIVAALSAVALSAAVVIEQIVTGRANKQQTEQQNKLAACQQDTKAEPILPVPEIYKPATKITELEKVDLVPGTGAAVKPGDCLVVKYYGTLAATGEKFDENFTTSQGFEFVIGQNPPRVIQGWDQGLRGMKVGGTRRLAIPSQLAYGNQNSGSIPPNSDLVFIVKLLRIQQQ